MNKRNFFILISLVISAYLMITLPNDHFQAIDTRILYNIKYGENPLQNYDIYLPKKRSIHKTKVIVFIHGGGWISGDKKNSEKIINYLRNAHPNHTIVTTNYRLAKTNNPVTPAFPNQFLDIGLLLEHLKSKKEAYQILPEFGLIGSSAGGHIALLYDYTYDTNDLVKMVCSIAGPTDLTNLFYQINSKFHTYSTTLVDKKAYPKNTDYLKIISPLHQVTAKSSPTLLFYGESDQLVPFSDGVELKKVLTSYNIKNELILFKGKHSEYWSTNFENKLSNFISKFLAIPD